MRVRLIKWKGCARLGDILAAKQQIEAAGGKVQSIYHGGTMPAQTKAVWG